MCWGVDGAVVVWWYGDGVMVMVGRMVGCDMVWLCGDNLIYENSNTNYKIKHIYLLRTQQHSPRTHYDVP